MRYLYFFLCVRITFFPLFSPLLFSTFRRPRDARDADEIPSQSPAPSAARPSSVQSRPTRCHFMTRKTNENKNKKRNKPTNERLKIPRSKEKKRTGRGNITHGSQFILDERLKRRLPMVVREEILVVQLVSERDTTRACTTGAV